ncbi:MAG: PD-(D/E)XK nuclease family protein [Halanaeroarchaeum sp.]
MPISRLRPLQSIYEDVAEYDIVVVPNNPLADAIDRRVESPQFGTFATTPRRLATGRREAAEDRTAFLETIDRTDHSWKAIAHAIGNVLQCWEQQGTADAIFEYPAFVDEPTTAVVDVLTDLSTTSNRLTTYEIPADRSVAVVGYDQLTPLERSILPEDADHVDLFSADAFDLPPFNVFDAPHDIVDALLDTVTEERADDVAVVLDRSSRYASLVESALESAGIPFYGGPGFSDDPHHRAFLALLRVAHRGSDTTVGDVRPICTQLGIDVPVQHDEQRVEEVDLADLDWLTGFADGTHSETVADALAEFEHRANASLDALREELDTLGMLDERPTAQRVADLAFYLQTYEVPVDRETEGVILADAGSSGYVDRPTVFFIGMDEGWTQTAPQRPWVDADAQYERYLRQFQLLLQSGSEQYYLVQDTAGGEAVTPCLYFAELLEEEYERFSDLESVSHDPLRRPEADGFDREPLGIEPTAIETVSQSSLNRFVNSPRDYLFSTLLDGPDKDYFREGNLFHDFAEFYVEHPDRIGPGEIEEVVEVMLEETGAFYTDEQLPLRRRKYRVGLETIVEYLDANPPEDHDFLTPSTGFGRNYFAHHFDRPVDSPLTERWFEDDDLGIKGKIDLVRGPTHLLDYKSGRKKSAYGVVKASSVDPPADTPNFQAALYLTHFRRQRPDQRIEFTFFYFLSTLDDVVTGDATLEDALTTITYHPMTFDEYVETRAAYDVLLEGYDDCVATFEDLGFERYREIVGGLEFPATTARDELRDSEFAASLTAAVEAETGEGGDAAKGADQAIRALNGVRKRAYFEEDLDAFEEFVRDRIAEINRYRAGEDRFPVDGPGGEPNYRRVDHRDLLLEGEDR